MQAILSSLLQMTPRADGVKEQMCHISKSKYSILMLLAIFSENISINYWVNNIHIELSFR